MSDTDFDKEKGYVQSNEPITDGIIVVQDREGEGLQRKLKTRHAQMISIGGVIGTGLFLGTASSLAHGGPGGLLLGYLAVSSVCIGASIKVLTIIGLIILGLVIDLGGAPTHDRLGFRYWHHPGAFVQFEGIGGSKGRFLGFWTVLINAAYAFLGTEILGMTAAEISNPTKNIPRAIRGVYVRILVFYIVGVFILGLICPSNNPGLLTSDGTANGSPWVIAIKLGGIKALPSIINACLLTSAWSAGSSDLYTSSRALFGLAKTGQAPKIFARTNKYGTPWPSLVVSTLFGLLAYMGVTNGSSQVFTWFSNMSSVTGMLNWMGICITLIRFRAGLKLWKYISLKHRDFKRDWQTKIVPASEMDFVTFVNFKTG
ncbi:hypothetical protein Clacol_007340 [Clathrus columnatus]|uniref:Amino acid permease/ SLC12A domain-containing protein n=1 Tax=Clathrus columnatus TaxID=1419009 RepID=A0AAV5AMD3_9AGAM|nr:hypothetical protein Clacol_007340 [Clathrus columnatus]